MLSPKRITKEFLNARAAKNNSVAVFISGSDLHPAIKLYKYYWWIYAQNFPYESAENIFFKKEHRLTTKEALEAMKKLDEAKIFYAYINIKYKRLGNTIWDYEAIKRKYPDIEFALTYEDDTDAMDDKGFK